MGYFDDALRGFKWMSAFRISYRIIGIIRISIVAHLLSPYDLGLFAIATITLSFLEILTETGINLILIQEKENIDDYINTAWITSILRGLVISILIFVMSPLISSFFNSPGSKNILMIVALVPLIRGFINPSIIKFQKNLEFNKDFIYRVSVFFVESITSIIFVSIYKTPIVLCLGLVIGAIYEVFYTQIIIKPNPLFKLDLEKLKHILGHAKWFTLFGVSDYIFTQLDNIVVGKLLGVFPLGIYQNAYKISTALLTEIGDVFYRVTFPVYSKINSDKLRLKNAFIKTTIINSILMSMAGIFIYIFADPIVNILLGKQWLQAIGVVRLLAVLGTVRGIAASTNALLVAQIKQKYSALITLVSALVLSFTIVPLVKAYGLYGASISAIIGTLISLPLTIYYVQKTLKS